MARDNESDLPPEVGHWITQIRRHHGHSRKVAATRLHISETSLKRIERRQLACSRAFVERLATEYELTPAQKRYTYTLASPSSSLPPRSQLRNSMLPALSTALLAEFERRGFGCGYFDPLWNLIEGNDLLTSSFPGIDTYDGNLALWHFQPGNDLPTSRQTTLEWELESIFYVATLRAALGSFRDSPHAKSIWRQLRRSREFSTTWSDSLAVAYGRRPDQPAHLLDASTRKPFSARIYMGECSGNSSIIFYFIYRSPYAGPPIAATFSSTSP
ncbi:helix-turn-helix domain-containing protein [Nocardia sp. NPDC003482]